VNNFVFAVHSAFDTHFPLVLTPDVIWFLISHGFAKHVNKNAEELRSLFVSHQGKKELKVIRDDFVKGKATNPWQEVFPEFTDQIKEYIGDETHDLILADFSTTGPVERAVSEIVLMDAMQSYFSYTCLSSCERKRKGYFIYFLSFQAVFLM